MRRAIVPLACAAAVAGCGTEPLTPAQFDRAAQDVCAQESKRAGRELRQIQQAHARARKRIRALEASPQARKRAAPVLERLDDQGRRLDELVQARRADKPAARLVELAGAADLEQRLAGDAGGLKECLAIGAGLGERLAATGYAAGARRLLRRGRRLVFDSLLRDFPASDRSAYEDLGTFVYLDPGLYSTLEGPWSALTPPRELADEHRAVKRSIDRMTTELGEADGAAGDSGRPLSAAQRHLRRFHRARRDFRRAAARLLRELR